MSNIKWIFLAIFLLLVMGGLFSMFSEPPKADFDDYFVEDIGGDGFLIANLTPALKTAEGDVADGCIVASTGPYYYYGAKNISFVDEVGSDNYMIVWKTTPDKYDFFNTADNINQYISDYSTENNEVCFIEYSYENNAVYGIIISNEHVKFSESKLMYDILGLDKDSYSLVYTQQTSSYGYSSSSSDHYHTVVPDRYSLSRSDPGAYYDHYEYGDNYEIDDYLESEGYD